MSADTVASTIYSDSQTVVVYIGSTPILSPWLAYTTYLLDKSGHTTGVLVQTDQPAGGVTNTPVHFTTQTQTAQSSTTASTLPSGWVYKGCYNDVFQAGRVLSLKQPNNSNLTVQGCVWSCYQLGFSISGLEFREQCYCGNALYNGGTLSDWDFDCNMQCTGNKKEVCGGSDKISIYSNETLTTYQSAAVATQTSVLTAPVTTLAPSPPSGTSRMAIPGKSIAIAVLGAVMGIAIVGALIFYLRRRIKRNRLRMESQMQQTLQLTRPNWLPADRVPSWEEFMKVTEDYYAAFDEGAATSNEGNSSGLGLKITQDGGRPSIPELRQKYEQLNLQWSHNTWRSSNTGLASPTRYQQSQIAPARPHLGHPTSILKRPAPTGTTKTTQSISDREDEQRSEGGAATKSLARAKKGVRFGVNQIREFSRSPFLGHGSEASST